MTVDVETQISTYARWLEDQTGVSMRKPTASKPSAPSIGPRLEVLDEVPIRVRANHDGGDRRGGVRWLAVAACVVALVGGLAILTNRATPDPTVPAAQPTDPATDRTAGTAPVAPAGECPDPLWATGEFVDAATRPADAPGGVLLPVDTPTGFCAQGHIDTFTAPQRYTVWATCSGCADLRGAVALVRTGNGPDVTEDPPRQYDVVDIAGRTARFYPPDDTSGITNLTSYDGQAPEFMFFGWGVTEAQLVGAATQYLDGNDTPGIDGFELVFDDQLNALWPGLSPLDATVQISYGPVSGDPAGDGEITYLYQSGADASVNLDAFTPGMPNATFTTINSRTAVTSQSGDSATIVIAADEHAIVGINGWKMPLDTLTGIDLTTATPDDPRWAQFGSS